MNLINVCEFYKRFHKFQRFQIYTPRYRTNKGRRCKHVTWSTYGPLSRTCLAKILWNILDTWPNYLCCDLSIRMRSGSTFTALPISQTSTLSRIVTPRTFRKDPISAVCTYDGTLSVIYMIRGVVIKKRCGNAKWKGRLRQIVRIKWAVANKNFHTGSSCFTVDFWLTVRISVALAHLWDRNLVLM